MSCDFGSRSHKFENSHSGFLQESKMAKSIRGFCRIVPLAIVAVLGWQQLLVAESKSWNADQLSSPFPARQTEKALIEQLRTGSRADKAIACKQLAIYGSKAAVPDLAKLLPDEELSSWSRVALEAIDDPAADAALIEAAKTLSGKLLVGTINTLGVRRSAGAVDVLIGRLKDENKDVASASAVALGKIGNEKAVSTLRQSLASASPEVRSAVAEGCILCAEELLAGGKSGQAVDIYDAVRKADVGKQRKLEATRGAIVARGEQGMPLMVELLKSQDHREFRLALKTARELLGTKVEEALLSQIHSAEASRAALIVVALGDREGAKLSPAIVEAARHGDNQVRLAAIQVTGQLGDVSSVPALLEIASGDNAELSQGAKAALAALRGDKVSAELTRRLTDAKGKQLELLIDVVGQRRMDVADELVKVLDHGDASTRKAALLALGTTARPKDVKLLIAHLNNAKNDADAEVAEQSLQTACIRMPDREATAAELAAAIPQASTKTKVSLVKTLGAMGGPKALEAIAVSIKGGDENLQDAGTKTLGQWMTVDAAPTLLEISKSSAPDKYRVRALRGYLRLARQLKMSNDERLAMCRLGLAAAERIEERELVLDALKRCPSAESVQMASALVDDASVRDRAVETAIFIGEKIKDKDPAAAKSAGEKALKAVPNGKLAERARALANSH
jgi:HEAT repeat protein